MSNFDKITHFSEVQDFQRNLEYFGNFLVESRKKNNKKRVDIATELNISFKTVERWEKGEGFPEVGSGSKISSLDLIAKAYEVELSSLERALDMSKNARERELSSRQIKTHNNNGQFDPSSSGVRVSKSITKRF